MIQFDSNPNSVSGKDDLEAGGVYLSDVSSKDSKWDYFRSQADTVAHLYRGTVFDRYAGRISGCSGLLEFVAAIDSQTGLQEFRLKSARFCRVPRCPVCQWRRSLMWRAKAFKILPKLFEDYPKARFIFLTLTVRNCHLEDLRQTLASMNAAWNRLVQRKHFPALGWIKAVEVTRDKDDWAHPHFHCLLMVPPGYFAKPYLSQAKWSELWQKSLRVQYTPIVDVRVVKSETKLNNSMLESVLETLKYSVKPQDLVGGSDPEVDSKWLVELTKQLYKTKSIATGGLLKEYLKVLESEPEDFIHTEESLEGQIDYQSLTLYFEWLQWIKRYAMQR